MQQANSWTLEISLLTLAIALLPFYAFPSGGIQPSHLAFLLLFVVAVRRYGMLNENWILLILVVSIYAFLIEAIYAEIYGNTRHLITAAYFLFNLFLSVGVYQVVLRNGARVLKIGILAAAAFAVISVFIGGVDLREVGDVERSTGAFNNPNQLGYFSACLLSLSYLLYRHGEIRFLTALALFAISIFLAVVSLSKAAMIANFLVVVFTLRRQGGTRGTIIWIGLAVIVLGAATYLFSAGYFDNFQFYDRIANMQQERDSSLEERGYFAFLEGTTAQIIFGMGSPEVFRIVGHEVHSTFASILNYYGIVGFGLFTSIFVIWSRALYRAYGFAGTVALQGPAILYGITHNGTRFSHFLAAFFGIACYGQTGTPRSFPLALATRHHDPAFHSPAVSRLNTFQYCQRKG